MPEKHRLVSEIDFENYRSNRKPERGDVLLTRVGAGIGEAAVLDSDFEFAFCQSLLDQDTDQTFESELSGALVEQPRRTAKLDLTDLRKGCIARQFESEPNSNL